MLPQYEAQDREPIWAALMALLKAKLGSSYTTMGRHLVQPPSLSPEQQPALFVVQARETRAPRPGGLPGKVTLSGFIIIYFRAPEPLLDPTGAETAVGATVLNGLLLGIDAALQPDNVLTGYQTLGGLVTHCWVEGDTDVDAGIYTQQGAAIVPIKILVP